MVARANDPSVRSARAATARCLRRYRPWTANTGRSSEARITSGAARSVNSSSCREMLWTPDPRGPRGRTAPGRRDWAAG